ncbi:MAG: ABC transporter ATP-binding protein [Bacteroidales bacterium]|jgi:subfamily B ATP-binding cassette protein MsbA|nr:ABC transporter ATP-binding protein [Bacteroidales bacterium]MDD3525572.1 ABC transporter ATP-binding protein [Bacteroidales bacterium]MDD4177089.1 ABC transporter ATP-binding protein [Bacteroidales bacterium]MDD4740922.1 ABC transporter ATP-binding protein [Bacteroidales bacterium]MDY0335550.1 ABC transporter ATP-binding protein [Bacteroidales bacterium]
MKRLLEILQYIKNYLGYASLNVLFNVLSVIFNLFSLAMVIPFLQLLFDTTKLVYERPALAWNTDAIANYFNYIISSVIIEHGQVQALMFISLLVVALFFLKNLSRYLAMFFLSPLRNGVVRDLRNDIYRRILILPLSYFSEQRKGDIMSRITNDVMNIEWSIMQSLEMLFREPLTILFFLVTLIVISPTLTLFVVLLLPIAMLLIAFIGKSLRRTSARSQRQLGTILSIVEETISGLRIIKGFNAIEKTDEKFREQNDMLTRTMVRLFRKRDLASPMSEFLSTLVLVVVLWFGGQLVLEPGSNLPPTVFIFYVVVFSQLIVPVKSVTEAYYNVQKGVASAERIREIIDADEVILEKPDALRKNDFSHAIEYRNVYFAYEKEEVLKNINLKIPKGKMVALVGASGSGKSTLVDLLPRFYDCTAGEILIDGVNIRDLRIEDLRGLMGIVTQETILFNDTVFNNIAFGMENVERESVVAAAKIANAHEFISSMPNGYDTNIGDRGIKMSGGQRQRISIARAVLKNPPVMILDEATSALDTESERLVQDALLKLMKNRTSVVIAHRLSTIQHADEIVVLDKAEIVERGTHHELLSKGGFYSRLIAMQSFGK